MIIYRLRAPTAQAILRTSDPMSALAGGSFDNTNVLPIADLWRERP